MTDNKFNSGDLVKLKGFDQLFLVTRPVDAADPHVTLLWFNSDTLEIRTKDTIPASCLVKVD
jgi:hypothetical protein